MKLVGFLLKEKSDKIEAYKKHQQNVWTELLKHVSRVYVGTTSMW